MTEEKEKNNEQSATKEESTSTDENESYSDLYPGRKNTSPKSWLSSIFGWEKRNEISRTKCEVNVLKCVRDSPLVKLMMAALKNSGCEIDLGRHISCEMCDSKITGGYDPYTNQIIICQNSASNRGRVQSTLAHEMIHMFDYCRNKMDLNNIHHLACTEIRAANLCHCSFLGAVARGTASPFNVKQAHQECVKDKAVRSIVAIKNVSKEEAYEAVLQVFTKCYNDLEPIGRRIRRNSLDMEKAYYEASLYG